MTLLIPLTAALSAHGFRPVDAPTADLLMKRQNFNTNRAVIVVSAPAVPQDFGAYVREVRDDAARRCRYIPVLWPIGIQLVAVAPGITTSSIDPKNYIALVDNQTALIQSVFLVDPERGEYVSARTWGQFITGKFQDAIEGVLQSCGVRQR
jgi:hypothetical protein